MIEDIDFFWKFFIFLIIIYENKEIEMIRWIYNQN